MKNKHDLSKGNQIHLKHFKSFLGTYKREIHINYLHYIVKIYFKSSTTILKSFYKIALHSEDIKEVSDTSKNE